MNIYNRYKILKNHIFMQRYIDQHCTMLKWGCIFGFDRDKKIYYKILHNISKFIFIKLKLLFIYKLYIIARFLFGKIDLPYLQIVVTTKCSLQCRDCHDLMPQIPNESHYNGILENIITDLNIILNNVSSIASIRILGGEPLLFKDLPKLLNFIKNQNKIKSFDIISNATIKFNSDLIKELKNCFKVRVFIDDYTQYTNKATKQKLNTIIGELNQNKIKCFVLNSGSADSWFETGKVFKRNRKRTDIINNFLTCGMYCVSYIGSQNDKSGSIFICPRASSMSKIFGIEKFNGDYIALDSKTLNQDFINFYTKDFFECCDYCHDMDKPKKMIPAGIQIDK